MRRVVFGIALSAGVVFGVCGVRAENENIGGDLDWPKTPIVDDAPIPQQGKPKSSQANRQQGQSNPDKEKQETQGPSAPGQRVPNSTQTKRYVPGQQQFGNQGNNQSEREARRPRGTARGSDDGYTDEAAPPPGPPLPDRRRVAAPTPQVLPFPQVVPVAGTLPQVPPVEHDDGLRKIIGQMLIIGFQGVMPDESWPRQVAAQIETGKIGGVLVMSHNVKAPQQLAKLTGAFRRTKAQIAPFIAIDQEGGTAPQLSPEKGFQRYASAAELGRSNDPLNAYNLYQRMAIELTVSGFNVNFGPVVDLNDGAGAAVNDARYGSQPKHVAAFAKAFRMAHHSEGMLTVLKRFPGVIPAAPAAGAGKPDQRWDPAALEPYRQLVQSGNSDMVMIGHVVHPDFSDAPGMPASLSEKAIETRLRGEIGFKGLVVSDDLQAKALIARFPLEDSVVRAIKAGNDLLLISNLETPTPDLPEKVAFIIKQAVTTGALTRERLQASYDRIVAAKQSLSAAAREIASAKQPDGDEEKPAAP